MDYSNKVFRYINSKDRDSGTSSNFTITLDLPPNLNRVAVAAFAIPKVYYGEFGTFTLTETSPNGTSSSVLISTQPGNYDIDQFRLMISSLLNAASPNGLVYLVRVNSIIGKFIFTVNSQTIIPSISTNDTIYEALGLDPNTTSFFTNGFLTSTNVVNVNLDSNLFLKSNICTTDQDSILQEVYTTQNKANQFITWYSPNVLAYSKPFNQGKSFSFWLTDGQNNVIDLNGGAISITLVFFTDSLLPNRISQFIDLVSYQMLKANNMPQTSSVQSANSIQVPLPTVPNVETPPLPTVPNIDTSALPAVTVPNLPPAVTDYVDIK
jgi:hypothetical protein